MGVTAYHRDDLLRAATEADARAAIKIINDHNDEHGGMHASEEPHRAKKDGMGVVADWRITLDDYDGDHYHGDAATALYVALAAVLDSGSFLELEIEGDRFRVYWNGRGQVFEQTPKRTVWNTPGVELAIGPSGNNPSDAATATGMYDPEG